MTQAQLAQVIQSYSGSPTRISGDEIKVKICASCGNDRWNLEVNQRKNVFNCWVCDFSGQDIRYLLQKIGYTDTYVPETTYEPESYTAPDLSQQFPPASGYPEAVAYLEARGLALHDVRHYSIGYRPWKARDMWSQRVVFPLKNYWSGELVGYQGRTIVNREPTYYLSNKITDFIGYRANSNIHVVTEGVFDALSVHKAGYNSVFLLGVGNVGEMWRAWAGALSFSEKDPKVVVLLDGDAHGKAKMLASHISQVIDSCHTVLLRKDIDPGRLSPKQITQLIGKYVT